MIPTTDKEALDELQRVRKANKTLITSIAELVADDRYSRKDREGLAAIAEFVTAMDDIVGDVMKGMATMAVAKKPSDAASIIDALTK